MFAHGTAAQRKAMIEATVAEIRFEGTSLLPVFKVPEEATRPVAKTGLSSGTWCTVVTRTRNDICQSPVIHYRYLR